MTHSLQITHTKKRTQYLSLKIFSLILSPDDDEKAVKRGYLANEYDFQGMKT